jgi:hypothetical protein
LTWAVAPSLRSGETLGRPEDAPKSVLSGAGNPALATRIVQYPIWGIAGAGRSVRTVGGDDDCVVVGLAVRQPIRSHNA